MVPQNEWSISSTFLGVAILFWISSLWSENAYLGLPEHKHGQVLSFGDPIWFATSVAVAAFVFVAILYTYGVLIAALAAPIASAILRQVWLKETRSKIRVLS